MSQEWIDDCMKYWGRVLTGKLGHWCYDWDGLPIDETCEEFSVCCCFKNQSTEDEINKLLDSD